MLYASGKDVEVMCDAWHIEKLALFAPSIYVRTLKSYN